MITLRESKAKWRDTQSTPRRAKQAEPRCRELLAFRLLSSWHCWQSELHQKMIPRRWRNRSKAKKNFPRPFPHRTHNMPRQRKALGYIQALHTSPISSVLWPALHLSDSLCQSMLLHNLLSSTSACNRRVIHRSFGIHEESLGFDLMGHQMENVIEIYQAYSAWGHNLCIC